MTTINKSLITLIILLEGFVTISVEILTIRQLMPVAGNSVAVTSLIIGIFLLFLAYGYRKGGMHKTDFKNILTKNFCWAAAGIGIGLSYFFIELFFYRIQNLFGYHILIPLIAYLLLITAPIVYLLGQTVPITLNFYKKDRPTALAGGKIMHLSTIGSFLGSILTSLLLFNFAGVAWTVVTNFIVLMILVLLLLDVKKHLSYLVIMSGCAIAVYALNIYAEKKIFITTNSYNNYNIVQDYALTPDNHGKLLVINDSLSSFINNRQQAFPYAEYIKKILFDDLKLHNKNILVLGGGGFTLSAGLKNNDNHFTYIDIDQHLPQILQGRFLEKINGTFIADDARHYLTQPIPHYDVIISDAYSNRNSLPTHLLTYEFFAAIKHNLNNNGIAIFNIIARPELNDAYSKRLDNTIRTVFTSCMATPLHYTHSATNIIYICSKNNFAQEKNVYADNFNSATLDFFTASF